jgi:Protein of unknown function (DUF2637)
VNRLSSAARAASLLLMAVGVLVATGDGFAQSYAGLFGWAHEHRLAGWRADSFPLLIDTFVFVGELALFLLAIDGHRLTRRTLSWLDLGLPAVTVAAGWAVSLVFNVGRIQDGTTADKVTAAVPPVAAMAGLVILLRTLHRYVTSPEAATHAAAETSPPEWATASRPLFWPPFQPAPHPVADDAPETGPDRGTADQGQPPAVGDDHAGQQPPGSLADAVVSASRNGWSERTLATRFEISRHKVRAILSAAAATTPAATSTRPHERPLTTVNGSAAEGEQRWATPSTSSRPTTSPTH